MKYYSQQCVRVIFFFLFERRPSLPFIGVQLARPAVRVVSAFEVFLPLARTARKLQFMIGMADQNALAESSK